LPDLLDEALWLPHFLQRARAEITAKGWGTGGVPGARVFGDLWGADTPNDIGRGSWQDTDRDWYLLGEDPWMSYKYAGLAAHIAWLLQQNGWADPNINWQDEAISAWTWAKNNTKPGDEIPKLDYKLAHSRMYAAAHLLRLTNDAVYNTSFIQDAVNNWPSGVEYIGGEDLLLATYFFANLPAGVGASAQKTKAKQLLDFSANVELVNTANGRACRWGGNFYFPMLVGQATTPMVEAGILSYLLNKTPDPTLSNTYLNSIRATADYFLGNNPLNMAWVSGVGERHQTDIFHLDWWYGGQTAVLPGVTSYGPWRSGNYGPLGPWNHMWASKFTYPEYETWPGHERYFSQRTSPLACEFTVHQTTRLTSFTYGVLSDGLTSVASKEPKKSAESFFLRSYFEPTQRVITVENPAEIALGRLAIFNLNGQLLEEQNLGGVANTKVLITLRNALGAGVFVAQITAKDGRTSALKMVMH
jgi:endoglucanase